MSVTGACLILFLTFHVLMNAVAIVWPTAYNTICQLLGANWYALSQGTFGTKPLAFGIDAVFIALLLVLAMVMAFMTKNPTVGILAGDIGFTVATFIGLLNAPLVAIGFMWLSSAVLMYILNRR